MYGNRFCAVIGALLIVIATASCLPETEALLSDPSSAKVDQRLLGDWSAKDNSDGVEVTFRRLGTVKVPYDGIYVSIGRPVITMPREKLVAFLRDKGRGSIFMKGASILQRSATAPAPKN